MEFAQPNLTDAPDSLPRMPPWVTSARAETLEDVAFLSGAALATLHLVVGHDDVPHALLRDRLAVRAAEACVSVLRLSLKKSAARELENASTRRF